MSSKKKKKYRTGYEEYKIYYGIPHCHTMVSTGRGTIKEAISYTKKKYLDYIIFTDHCSYLLKKSKEEKTYWNEQKELIDKHSKKHRRFLAALGFEYKLFSSLDINVLCTEKCIDKKLSIDEFFRWLRDKKGIGIINHPGKSIDKIKKDLYLNRYIRCIEVGNGSYPNKYKRYYRQYFHMLDLGWELAAINGQDNHRKNWGDSDNVTAALLNKLSVTNLIDAYSKGHTYSTESKTLKIHFSINNFIMGETVIIDKNGTLSFKIRAEDADKAMDCIKVYTNGGNIVKEIKLNPKSNTAEYLFEMKSPIQDSWYVVNILTVCGKEAITSPIYAKVR